MTHTFSCTAFLSLLCILTPAISAQETDWPATIKKAHKHRRLMLRRAASNKIANAADASVAAVRGWEKEHGRNAIAMELVAAYSRSKKTGDKTIALLMEWAQDRDFYWRSQALEALANRRVAFCERIFRRHLDDASYLTRIQAGRGLCRLGDPDLVLPLLRDRHPSVRVRTAICMVEEKDLRGLPTLVGALSFEGKFFDYPWGAFAARNAFRALKKVAGADFDFALGESPKHNAKAIAKFDTFVRIELERREVPYVAPAKTFRDNRTYLGGVAIRSCRNGDLFVRVTDDSRVVFGLEADAEVRVPEASMQPVVSTLPAAESKIHGKVICDYLRIMWQKPTVDLKFAPGHLRDKPAKWLSTLAVTLEKKGSTELAQRIRSRLVQFR